MPRLDDAPVVVGGALGGAEAAPTVEQVGLERLRTERELNNPFQQGLRSGWEGVKSGLSSLAGTVGENMGLTEFAQSRFNDADMYARAADTAAPEIRDYRAVGGLRDAGVYVMGLLGNAAATMGPTVATAALTRGRAIPTYGVAGSMMAGEQDVTMRRESPQVSAADRLRADIGQGLVGGALEAAVPLAVARRAARGAGSRIGQTMVGEAATEAAQTVSGQQIQGIYDPNRDTSEDVPETINAAIGGLAGGGGMAMASQVPGAVGATAQAAQDLAPKLRETFDGTLAGAKKLLDKTPSVEELKGMTLPDEVTDIESAVNFVMESEKSVRAATQKAADWVGAHDLAPAGLKKAMKEVSEKLNDPMLDPEKLTELAESAKKAVEKLEIEKKVKTATKKVKEYSQDALDFAAGFRDGPEGYDGNFEALSKTKPKKSQLNLDLQFQKQIEEGGALGDKQVYSPGRDQELGTVGAKARRPRMEMGQGERKGTYAPIDPKIEATARQGATAVNNSTSVGNIVGSPAVTPTNLRALPTDENTPASPEQLQALVEKFSRTAPEAPKTERDGAPEDLEVLDIMTEHLPPEVVEGASPDSLLEFSKAQQAYVRSIVQKTIERRAVAIQTGSIQNEGKDVKPLPFRPDAALVALYGSPAKAKAALTAITKHMFKRGDWAAVSGTEEDTAEVPRIERSLRNQATYGKAVNLAVARQLYPTFLFNRDVRNHVADSIGQRVSDWLRDPKAESAASLVTEIKDYVKDPEGLLDTIFSLQEQRRQFRGERIEFDDGGETVENEAPAGDEPRPDIAAIEAIGKVGDVAGGPGGDRTGFGLPQRREPADAELRAIKALQKKIASVFENAVTKPAKGEAQEIQTLFQPLADEITSQPGFSDEVNEEHQQFVDDLPAKLEQLWNRELSAGDKKKQAREMGETVLDVAQGRGTEWYALSTPARYNSGTFIVNLKSGTKRVDTQRLFNAMNRRYKNEPGAKDLTDEKYVADMFSRGVSHLVSDERVRQNDPLTEKGFNTFKDGDVLVRHNGTPYTWKQIKEAGFGDPEDRVMTVGDVGTARLGYSDSSPKSRGADEVLGETEKKDRKGREYTTTQTQATDAARVVKDSKGVAHAIVPDDNVEAGYIEDELSKRIAEGTSYTTVADTLPSAAAQREAMRKERPAPKIKVTQEMRDKRAAEEAARIAGERATATAQAKRAMTKKGAAQSAAPEDVNKLVEDVKEAKGRRAPTKQAQETFEDDVASVSHASQAGMAASTANFLLKDSNVPDAVKSKVRMLMGKRNWQAVLDVGVEYVAPKKSRANMLDGSPIRNADGTISKEAQAAVRAEIERMLGKENTKVLFEELEGDTQGQFTDLDPIEQIQIGIMTGAPMATAYHETLHAFFARLTKSNSPKAKQAQNDLLEYANAPRTKTALEKIIRENATKDSVEKAIEQLSDPEERLAFAFQLWRQGKLEVGPRTDGWFNKIAAWLGKVFNIVPRDQRVLDYFDGLYRGRFANKGTLGEVLADIRRDDAFDQADAAMPGITSWMNKVVSTADGWIRDQKIPALSDLADKMSTGMGAQNKEPGFMQAKHVELNKRMNRLMGAVRGKSKEQIRLAMDALQKQDGVGPSDEGAKAIYKQVREILDEAHDYITKAGVKQYTGRDDNGVPQYSSVKKIENYFPQMWDSDAIRQDKAGFEKMLTDSGLKPDAARDVYNFITQMHGVDVSLGKNDISGTLQFRFDAANQRVLNNLDKGLAQKYMQKDLIYAMSSYLSQATKRAEWTRRFENGKGESTIPATMEAAKSQGMTDQTEKDMTRYLQAMEGTLGHDIPDELRNIFGGLTVYQNVRLLPFTLMSSLVDPMGIVVRGGSLGDAFQAYVKGVKGLFGATKDEDFEMASTIGAIEEASAMALYGDLYGSQYMKPWQRRVNSAFFKWNGMEAWNRGMRVASARAAVRFLDRHAGDYNKHSARYLAELNVTKADIAARNEKFEQAVNAWVDQSVLRPNASQRPIWMSDPHWQLVSHLKQFTYSFQKVILERVFHELKNGNSSPLMALSSYVPMMIAADVMRQMMTLGTDEPDKDLSEWMLHGVQRAGLLGPAQFLADAYGDAKHGKMGAEGLFGPTAEQAADLARATSEKGSLTDWFVRAGPVNAIYR